MTAYGSRLSGGEPHPRQVAGYDAAATSGLLPTVPVQPPPLLVRPTAQALFYRFVGLASICVLAAGALAGQSHRLPLPALAGFILLGLMSLGVLVGLLRALPAVGRQSIAELQQGYTTLVLQFGGFWYGEGPLTLSGEMRAQWDYRGTWHLDRKDGKVLRAPDRSVDPPGMYPSPHRSGHMELWTGARWLGHYSEDA